MTRLAGVFLQLILLFAAHAQSPSNEFTVTAAEGVSQTGHSTVETYVREGLARLAPMFPGTPTRGCRITVHATDATLPDDIRASLHEGTAGVALLRRSEIHLMLDASRNLPPHDLRTVVDHEIVHILLDQHAGPHVSRWFHEGLAQLLSGGAYIGMSEDDLVITARADRLLRFADLRYEFPGDRNGLRRAYAQSFSFVGHLHRKFGLPALLECARASTPDGGFRAGFVAVQRAPLLHEVDAWKHYVLTGSGAPMRFLLNNCFSFLMVIGLPLLALAAIRRFRRDEAARQKLAREDRAEDDADSLSN